MMPPPLRPDTTSTGDGGHAAGAAGDARRDVDSPAGRAFARLECEHIAALLKSAEELPPVVASFLGLGAARNGWLVHGSLPGEADADRERLRRAGLDVSGLTRGGRLEMMELDLSLTPEEWVRPWSAMLDERLGAGFAALWFARFPVRGHDQIGGVLPFEEAWQRCFRGRPVVTLCPYIFAGVPRGARAARLDEVTAVHDRVVDLGQHVASAG